MANEGKQTSRRSSKKKKLSMEVPTHRFPPGTEVGVYSEADTGPYRNSGREPIAGAISTSKVGKDGSLEIEAEEPGTYALGGKAEGAKGWTYLLVTVKE